MKKVKEWMHSKYMRFVVVASVVATSLVVAAGAAEEGVGSSIATAFSAGFQTVVTDSIAMLSAMVPIAVGLAGALFIVKKAMSWFKSVAK